MPSTSIPATASVPMPPKALLGRPGHGIDAGAVPPGAFDQALIAIGAAEPALDEGECLVQDGCVDPGDAGVAVEAQAEGGLAAPIDSPDPDDPGADDVALARHDAVPALPRAPVPGASAPILGGPGPGAQAGPPRPVAGLPGQVTDMVVAGSPDPPAAMGSRPLADPGPGLATSSDVPAPAVAQMAGAMPARPADPMRPAASALPVPRQIAEAVIRMEGERAEITLAPQELGMVRIALTREADRLVVRLWVERAETLDLMRRHADELARELAAAGEDGAQLDLAFSGQDPGGGHTPDRAAGQVPDAGWPMSATAADAALAPRRILLAGHVDLRL